MPEPTASVLINNYNYEQYVARAITSALGQTHPHVDVVVVDDGSTDGSLEQIRPFADRVTVVEQANAGMAAAMNAAFAASSGDWVFFLDADDFLHPECVATALGAAGPDTAKVHWRLRLVDSEERPFGMNPALPGMLASGDVADELCRTGTYATVPTSGNAYRRSALDVLMPVPEADFKFSGDGYLNLGIPFLGPVQPVDEPLSSYRVHDRNRSTSRGALDVDRLRTRLEQADVLDAWLPRLAARFGRHAEPGVVLGQLEFQFMQRLLAESSGPRWGRARRVLAGTAVSVAALRAPSLRARRRLLVALAAPALPLLPSDAVAHVRAVAYGGTPLGLTGLLRSLRPKGRPAGGGGSNGPRTSVRRRRER